MRACVIAPIMMVGLSPASAQPGLQAPIPGQVVVTGEDADLLTIGEINDAQHLGGGMAALFVGSGRAKPSSIVGRRTAGCSRWARPPQCRPATTASCASCACASGMPPRAPEYGMRPYVVPVASGDGAVAGLALRF
jgi:hypothetical protein